MASDTHNKEELKYSILYTDDNWFRRGVKEAIEIKKLKPTLNKDDGCHHLSAMYDNLMRSNVVMKTPDGAAKDGTEETNF